MRTINDLPQASADARSELLGEISERASAPERATQPTGRHRMTEPPVKLGGGTVPALSDGEISEIFECEDTERFNRVYRGR